MKRSRWLRFLLLGCGVLALVGVFLFMDPQPYCRGRSLGTWLVLYHQANQHFPTDPEPAGALREMGPRSLPFLVQWLSYERPPWKDKVLATLNRVPRPAHTLSTNLASRLQREWLRRENGYRAALWGFGVLGPAAQPAAASVGQLALRGKGPVADRATRVLMDMGTNAAPAVPLLLNALRSPDASIAARAIGLVQHLPVAWQPALQPCIALATEGNPQLRPVAISALGSLGDSAAPAIPTLLEIQRDPAMREHAQHALMRIPSYALPLLTNQVEMGSPIEQRQAVQNLGELADLARPALPVLLQAAARDTSLSLEVTNALRHIAPELVVEARVTPAPVSPGLPRPVRSR